MLYDLYMLACYFEPTMAVMYEDDLRKRYGESAVAKALEDGLLISSKTPCLCGDRRSFYRLSQKGTELARAG